MPTQQTPESTEPLPTKPTRLPGQIDWEKSPHRDHLIVLDSADPFRWADNYRKYPSSLAKSVMWFMYRTSGHFPDDIADQPAKYRDQMQLFDDHVASLSVEDKKILDEYAKHLAVLSMEEKSKLNTQEIPILTDAEVSRSYAELSPEHEAQLRTMRRGDMADMIEEHLDFLAAEQAASKHKSQ